MLGLIIFISLFVVGFFLLSIIIDDKYFRGVFLFFLVMFSICLGGAIDTYEHVDEPRAIDVYRGRTQLEITETVRDSLVIIRDTVVIFKANSYGRN